MSRVFRKSSRSNGNGGNCVECAADPAGAYVRDSKDRTGPELAFGHVAWKTFVERTKMASS
jgi:hypothetical protein